MGFKDAGERWNARYRSAAGLLFGEEPNAWLQAQAGHLPPAAKVCCLADGEGRNSTWLAAQGHSVSAFDISEVAIDKLAALAAARGVQVQASVGNADDWIAQIEQADGAESLDAVAAIFIQFADPPLRTRLFRAIGRALRPGGILIIEGYGIRQMRYRTGGPGIAENLYSLALLSTSFPDWATLAGRNVDIDIVEGSAHVGRSHLVSAVLRKPVG